VHPLEKSWFRPKFEALLRNRFEKTIYLDADLVVIADISDVFWLLDRFDVAVAHIQNRNAKFARAFWNVPIPNAFPQINGGVMGFRKNAATTQLLEECKKALIEFDLSADQPVLRELLLESDLRIAILPPEYNLRKPSLALFSGASEPAPRILHNSDFHKKMRGLVPPSPRQVYGRFFMRHVGDLLSADKTLGRGTGSALPTTKLVKKLLKWGLSDIRGFVRKSK